MKDKYIPDLIMAVLENKRAYYHNCINTPFVSFNKDSFMTDSVPTVEDSSAVQLSYLRDVLEDIFGKEEEK